MKTCTGRQWHPYVLTGLLSPEEYQTVARHAAGVIAFGDIGEWSIEASLIGLLHRVIAEVRAEQRDRDAAERSMRVAERIAAALTSINDLVARERAQREEREAGCTPE